uniref:Reverse transcriptase domain-containing protein n=1 Tax=Tanacetum cinerariifolium TaxID=118510 RepID=A0A6L2LCT7_TANCI|nr:reverse transcriptase domain-containing protein [Tanacetum cinerariifolium]
MEELLQAPTEGYGEAIVIPEILAENFEIKTNLLQLVQANKFHGRDNDNPHTHISNFKRMTETLKYRDVLNDAIKLMLFPFEETFSEAWDRFKELLRDCPHHGFLELTQIDTFYNGLTEQDQDSLNAALGGNLLNKTTREALKIIDNKSKVRYSRSKSNVSSINTNSRDNISTTDDRIDKLANQISNLVEIVNKQVIAPAKAVEKTCVTCGGAHAYYECIATDSNPSSVCAATGSYNQVSPPNRASHQIPPSGFAPVQNNPNRFNQGQGNYFNQANNFNQGNNFRGNNFQNNQGYRAQMNNVSNFQNQDDQNTEEILDKEHSNSLGSTAQVQPSVVPILILESDVPRTRSKHTVPYPSRINDQKLREKATNQIEKFFQIFHDLHFDISFADALLLMPKFASTIKSLLENKDKLFELAKVSLNEICSAMLLKKLPEKLGDPELTPTRMTLELADMSITRPKGVAEDVVVKVEKFYFPIDFVVVDFEADPRVPLILGRPFLRTGHALIDLYGEEITLRVNDESVTFNLDQVMRYSDNFVKRVNVINIASEEVVHDNTKSSNPTLVSKSDFCEDLIVKTSPFGESDFFLEEIDDFLNDDSIPAGNENSLYDPEGDILYFENLLKEDPFKLPPMNLNQAKSPIEEPEYSFSMGCEHFITTPVTKLNEVVESSAKNLVPTQSEYEVTSDNEKSKVYSNPLFDDDEIYFDELESHCLNVESNFVESLSNHDTVKSDHLEEFSGALMPIHIAEEERIRREHAEYISLIERLITINPCPRPTVNAYTIDKSLPLSLIPIQDNDSQREEIDIVTDTDELLPPGFKNDDSEGKINVLEELRIDNSISKNKLSDNEASDFHDPSFPRPPPEPPDVEFDFEPNSGEVISAVMNDNKELIDDECFDPEGEIDIFSNVKDDDYFSFTLVIQNFLPYLVYPEVFLLLLSAESEDTILNLVSSFRAGGISLGWNFHLLSCLSKH